MAQDFGAWIVSASDLPLRAHVSAACAQAQGLDFKAFWYAANIFWVGMGVIQLMIQILHDVMYQVSLNCGSRVDM